MRLTVPLGRFFGIDVRMHVSLWLLLVVAVAVAVSTGHHAVRGVALWGALCCAILVREVARVLAATYADMAPRAIYLFPVGGVMTLTPGAGGRHAPVAAWMRFVGPAANVFAAAIVLGFAYALDPGVRLFTQPWIDLGHILRSVVWLQVLMAMLGVLPGSVMPRSAGEEVPQTAAAVKPRPAARFGFGSALALAMIVMGLLMPAFYWLSVLGVFVLVMSQVTAARAAVAPMTSSLAVRDVMLTDYGLLSSSETLRGALERTTHSLQDIFPVVRGDLLVGSIGRQTITERLVVDGDSYLQGAMQRSITVAAPEELLTDALGRATASGAGDFVPVVENGYLVGILTPQNLGRAMQQVKFTRPAAARGTRS